MKLLWIADIEFGSTIHQVGELGTASALSRKSWEVDFLSVDWEGDSKKFLENLGFGNYLVNKTKIPGLGGFSFNRSVSKELPRILQSKRYDAILVEWHGSLGAIKAIKSLKKKGFDPPPFLFEDRSPPAKETILGKLQWIHYDLSWKKSHSLASAIEVLVPGLESFVRERFGDLPPMVHCPSGVEVDRFVPKFMPLKSKVKIVHHGSLDSNRGLDRIECFGKRLIDSGIDVEITIFGKGPLKKEFKKLSESLPWLNFLGEVEYSDVPELIAMNHFGILPLPDRLPWRVGSPLKLMEYASSGLPVLTTDVDGCLPFSGKNWACTADKSDPFREWHQYVQEFLEKPDAFEIAARQARKDAENHLTWDNAVVELDSELRRISKK